MTRRIPLVLAALLAACIALGQAVSIHDVFDRSLERAGITLVSWEGQIASPATHLKLVQGPKLYTPARVTLSVDTPYIEFNLFSELGAYGAKKVVFLNEPGKPEPFMMEAVPGIPLRDFGLRVVLDDANEHHTEWNVPIHVVRVTHPDGRPGPKRLHITLDFSKDATGFFADDESRKILREAADCWEQFLGDPGFDPVPAGAQKSWIFDQDTFNKGKEVTNDAAYSGYLLYLQGIKVPDFRSTGCASFNGKNQSIGGKATGLRRSGTVAVEVRGNYNDLGWMKLDSDKEFWRASNQYGMRHDLFSIVRHEIGHALIFHRVHPAFQAHVRGGAFRDPDVEKYLGHAPKLQDTEHFTDTIDPISRFGGFGNEYGGDFPRRRWTLTKFDLLVAKAVGYALQDTAPFWKLTLAPPSGTGALRQAQGDDRKSEVGNRKSDTGDQKTGIVTLSLSKGDQTVELRAAGGIPAYCFTLKSGKLPPGMTLDSFTGRISGKPTETGSFSVTVQVRDCDPAGPAADVALTIRVEKS